MNDNPCQHVDIAFFLLSSFCKYTLFTGSVAGDRWIKHADERANGGKYFVPM